MIKCFILISVMIMNVSCTSFGRGVTEAFLDSTQKEDLRKCEIKGTYFKGINDYLDKGEIAKVIMVHGVGTHIPGYATRIRENLAQELNLTISSKRPKEMTLLDPDNKKTKIGVLRAIKLQNEEKTKTLIFYELTWSEITNKYKRILDYDKSGEYAYKRAAINHSIKKFMDDTGPDPMVYLADKNNLMLKSVQQSTCIMMSKSWDQLKNGEKSICHVSSYNQIKKLNSENIIYITHSLGSRILMDSFIDIVESVAKAKNSPNKDVNLIVEQLKNKEVDIFMLANQLPILQIGRKTPTVNNQIPEYCSINGKYRNDKVFKSINIIAFSDPNDILSYDVPQKFVDEYMDSRMCPNVTNVDINIATEISAFGLGLVNPMAAHTDYDDDERVINIISNGTTNYKKNKFLSKRCRFSKLED